MDKDTIRDFWHGPVTRRELITCGVAVLITGGLEQILTRTFLPSPLLPVIRTRPGSSAGYFADIATQIGDWPVTTGFMPTCVGDKLAVESSITTPNLGNHGIPHDVVLAAITNGAVTQVIEFRGSHTIRGGHANGFAPYAVWAGIMTPNGSDVGFPIIGINGDVRFITETGNLTTFQADAVRTTSQCSPMVFVTDTLNAGNNRVLSVELVGQFNRGTLTGQSSDDQPDANRKVSCDISVPSDVRWTRWGTACVAPTLDGQSVPVVATATTMNVLMSSDYIQGGKVVWGGPDMSDYSGAWIGNMPNPHVEVFPGHEAITSVTVNGGPNDQSGDYTILVSVAPQRDISRHLE